MSYLSIQYLIHENLIRVFFFNAFLEKASEPDEDPCHLVAINTFVMGVPIRVTQGDVATAFDMPDDGRSDKHEGFLMSMLIPNDNALNL